MKTLQSFALVAALAAVATVIATRPVVAANAAELQKDSQAALDMLYSKNPKAKGLSKDAIAILVFPSVTKAGLGIGGQYGEGVLYKGGKVAAYYKTTGASVGLQAGGQKYGYALFYLSEETLKSLDKADGFEVGVGPSVVIDDKGAAKAPTTSTTVTSKEKIYAFIFDQKGAMAALGIQGNKVTKIDKK